MAQTTHPDALGRLVAARELRALAKTLGETGAATASGLWGSSVAAVVAAVEKELHRPIVVICGHLDEADDLADDIELFLKRRPEVLPALELGGSLGQLSEEQVSNRMRRISRLASGDTIQRPLMVAPIQALMQAVPSKDQLQHLIRTLKPGQALEPEKLIVWLAEHGYNRLDQVEVPGDFAVRGGIIDIYIPGDFEESAGQPAEAQVGLTVRIDVFGDQIESIKTFSLDTLGSGKRLDGVRIIDLKGLVDPVSSTHLFSYLPKETIVILWAPLEIAEQAKSYIDRLPEVKGVYPLTANLKNIEGFTRLQLSQFDQGTATMPSFVGWVGWREVPQVKLPVRSLQKFETEAKKAIVELAEFSKDHDITVFCENSGELNRFEELLEHEVPGLRKRIELATGYLHRGFVYEPGSGSDSDRESLPLAVSRTNDAGSAKPQAEGSARAIALLGHHELFHRYEVRRRVRKVIASRPVDSFLDLKVGDYVVHVAHGIAKFTGMQTITKDGRSEEYLTLRFAENAALHVPAARINLIQKYVGGFQ